MQIDEKDSSFNARLSNELFVFGDSLSDTGNIYNLTFRLVPPSPPYFNGRFSNGAVAAEILAEQLGLTLTQATNFAVGGAQTGRTNSFDSELLKLGGLLNQIDRFQAQATALGAGAEDLYFIWAGGNDFLTSSSNVLSDPVSAVHTAVANITTAVTNLAASGAKKIVVAKLPNLGRVPQAIELGQSSALTELSLAFNAALESTLTALETSLATSIDGINLILTDLFSTTESIAQTPSAFGFTTVTSPYLVDSAPADPNANPNQFFFWDQLHPTTRGHALFATTFRQTVISQVTESVTRLGTSQSDRLVGFSGSDRLSGFGSPDTLIGNGGEDRLVGGTAADELIGGNHHDVLIGGEGADILRGGLGQDWFVYNDSDSGRDEIIDFQVNQDTIDLKRLFNGATYRQSDRLQSYVRLAAVNDEAGSGTVIRVDTNGDLKGGFQAIAFLLNVATSDLTATTILV